MSKVRLLIAVDKTRFFYMKQFGDALLDHNVQYLLINDLEIYDAHKFSNKYLRWIKSPKKFEDIIKQFRPDVVLTERVSHFSSLVIKYKIPLIIFLRGDYWSEVNWAKETLYKSRNKRLEIWIKQKIANKCFKKSVLILPICKYLENIVKEHYPNKPTEVLYQGITPQNWYPQKGMNLKHPCVGLLQDARIWEKTKEMLTLTKVIETMPDVTFYWAGDGPYRDHVLPILEKYQNFKWLGTLQYPDEVRKFLTEIDVYALISGIDMSPLTLQEAQLMQKPVVATSVGGIPELMQNNETGFLVEKQNSDEIIEKISTLVNNDDKRKQMGILGRSFIEKNFNWEIIAKRFSDILNSYLDKK